MCGAEYWGVVFAMRCVVDGTSVAEQLQHVDIGSRMVIMSTIDSQLLWRYSNQLICLEM